MANAAVPAFYSWVIGDVVEKMARKFAEMGVDEHVLTELQQNWEERIRSARVAPFALPAAEQARGYAFKNDALPQHDGPADMTRAEIDGMMLELHSRRENAKLNPKRLPQTDGADDDDSNDDDDDAGGDSDINSELDDDDSEDENVETDHIILCQYEKVTRIKNKWKCVLKDGIVNIQGKDYLFNRVKKR